MTATDTMRWMGKSARNRASAMSHSVKDRSLEKRLGREHDEAERLRLENEMLRDEVTEARSEQHRILDLLERRMSAQPEVEVEVERPEKKSHKGRWLVFLTAIGGAAAWFRMRSRGEGQQEWSGDRTGPATTETGTSTM